jgi:NitT/TauT family transport system permease protein
VGKVLRSISDMPWVIRALSLVVFLTIWEIVGRQVNPLLFSSPSRIADAFVEMAGSGAIVRAALDSLYHLVVGFAIAAAVGIPIGLLMGRYRTVERVLDSFVSAAYVAPHVVFVPLMILWFGLGSTAKLVLISTATVFPILINTQVGARSVNGQLTEVGQAFCLSQRQLFVKIFLPAVTSHIAAGLRLGVGRAVTNTIIAEYFFALTGIGGLIITEANMFRTSKMFVGMVVLIVLGVSLTALVSALERKVAGWRETERAAR